MKRLEMQLKVIELSTLIDTLKAEAEEINLAINHAEELKLYFHNLLTESDQNRGNRG